MIAIEQQVSEAPPVCITIRWIALFRRAVVVRIADEDGRVIAWMFSLRWFQCLKTYREEVEAAKDDCRQLAEKGPQGMD